MNSPENFKPKEPEHLIGMVKKVASVQLAKIEAGRIEKLFLLLHGKPGCGKSSACKIISGKIGEPGQVFHLSACELSPEVIKDWIHSTCYSSMLGKWRVYWIEECDAISPTVETLMLQLIDKAAPFTAILCTSNKASKLTDRFQSRFQSIEVSGPKAEELESFLSSNWPVLKEDAGEIAESCKGDVRAALNDAQAQLDFLEFGV